MKLTLKQKYYQLIYRVRMLPNSLKYFFKNLWYYRNTLWDSRPWDYSGIYLAMRDQMFYMSESIDKYGNLMNKDKVVKELNICVKLLDRLLEDDYHKREYDLDNSGLGFKVISTSKYWFPTPKDKVAHKMADSLLKQDKELLFKIMSRKIRTWWS